MAKMYRSEAENRQVRVSKRVPKEIWINADTGDWCARSNVVVQRLCGVSILTGFTRRGCPIVNMALMRGFIVYMVSDDQFVKIEREL